MSTIYTYNGQILVDSSDNKWLAEQSAPPEVTIGTQTWKTANLAIDDGQGGIRAMNVTVNGVNFGIQYYYTYNAAQRVVANIAGWHIPTRDEWQTLKTYLGTNQGTKLKSTSGWNNDGNGTDDYGFNGLPLGNGAVEGYEIDQGAYALFWTSTLNSINNNYYESQLIYSFTGINLNSYGLSNNKYYKLSVRLIKDSE